MTEENPIPLFKVFMSDEAINLTSEVLSSGYVTQGPEVEKFEKKLKHYFSNEYVVSLNSATSGLHLKLGPHFTIGWFDLVITVSKLITTFSA